MITLLKETDRLDLKKYFKYLNLDVFSKDPRSYIFQLIDVPLKDWNEWRQRSYSEGDTVDVDLIFSCYPHLEFDEEYEMEFSLSEYVVLKDERIICHEYRELLSSKEREEMFLTRLIDLLLQYQEWCGEVLSGDLAKFFGYFTTWRAQQVIDGR